MPCRCDSLRSARNFQMWDQVTGSRSQMKTLPPWPVCRTSGCQRLRLQLTGWLGPRCWELLHQGRLGFFRHPKHALFEALFIRRWCSGTSVPSMCPMVNWCQRPSALATAGGNAQVQRVVCIALYYISYCTICIGHLSRYRDSGTTIAILWPNPSFWSVLLAMTLGWDEQVEEHNAILHTVAIYMFSIGTHSIRTAYAQHNWAPVRDHHQHQQHPHDHLGSNSMTDSASDWMMLGERGGASCLL